MAVKNAMMALPMALFAPRYTTTPVVIVHCHALRKLLIVHTTAAIAIVIPVMARIAAAVNLIADLAAAIAILIPSRQLYVFLTVVREFVLTVARLLKTPTAAELAVAATAFVMQN